MLKRLSKWAVVLAMVFVIGGHWALLQSVAWVGMTINFSKAEALNVALEKTFNGQNPCNLCHFVAKAKKSERTPEAQQPVTKLDFISVIEFALASPPENSIDLPSFFAAAVFRPYCPPSPPPRAV